MIVNKITNLLLGYQCHGLARYSWTVVEEVRFLHTPFQPVQYNGSMTVCGTGDLSSILRMGINIAVVAEMVDVLKLCFKSLIISTTNTQQRLWRKWQTHSPGKRVSLWCAGSSPVNRVVLYIAQLVQFNGQNTSFMNW